MHCSCVEEGTLLRKLLLVCLANMEILDEHDGILAASSSQVRMSRPKWAGKDAKELIDLDIDNRMTNTPAPAPLVPNSFANAALEIRFLRVLPGSPSIFGSGGGGWGA